MLFKKECMRGADRATSVPAMEQNRVPVTQAKTYANLPLYVNCLLN